MTIEKLWLDESGDAGFKFNSGSSQFLVIVTLYITNATIGENGILTKINEIKSRLRLPQTYEFKFSRCRDKFKKEFFTTFLTLPLQYKAIVVDKKKLKISPFSSNPHQLYCEAVRRLLYDNNPPLKKAILVIDEATAKIHYKEFNMVLKKYLSKKAVGKIRQYRSQSNILIQIADMIAGSIYRKFERKDDSYYKIARSKEKILIEF